MHFATACISLVSLIAATGYAAPSVPPKRSSCDRVARTDYTEPTMVGGAPHCPDLYAVEAWGYMFEHPSFNASSGFKLHGCLSANHKREDGDDGIPGLHTLVELVEDSCHVVEFKDGSSRPQYEIWDNVVGTLCFGSFCDSTKSISIPSGDGETNLVLSLYGQYASETIRDNFLAAAKESFLRSGTTIQEPRLPVDPVTLSSTLNIQLKHGATVDDFMTVHVTNVAIKRECPAILNAFNAYGSSFPTDIAPVFGFIAATCGVAASGV